MFVPLVFVVVVAALALVLRRTSRSSQGGEVVEDIPLPDQTEQGTVSLWVFKYGGQRYISCASPHLSLLLSAND